VPDPTAYLDDIALALIASDLISSYAVIRSWANTDDGYIRIRATLINGDFFEASEYFVIESDRIVTIDYRYQWMDGNRAVLRRRWDNTPHHPEIEGFPHHCHVGSETNIVPSELLSLLQVLLLLKTEIKAVE